MYHNNLITLLCLHDLNTKHANTTQYVRQHNNVDLKKKIWNPILSESNMCPLFSVI